MPNSSAGRRVSAFFAAYFAYAGLFSTYLALWLNGRGFSPAEIGVLVSPLQWARVVGPPAWGALADHVPAHRVPRVMQASALLALAFASCLLWDWSFWGLFLVFCAMSFALSGQVPIAESMALHTSQGDLGHYGRMRTWGSIGFIASVFLGGLWFDWAGVNSLPQTLLVLLALVVASAWFLPSRELVLEQMPQEGLAKTLAQPRVRWFLLASFLMLMAHAPLYTLFSLWLEERGYSPTEIGAIWTLGVLAEIVLFRYQRPLFARLGLSRGWRLSYGVTALRFGLLAVSAGSVWLLLPLQLLHAVTFGVHHTASMALVREWFPARAQARGQALYIVASYGLGGSLGGILSGWLYEHQGPEMVFGLAALMALLGGWAARRAAHQPLPQD